MAVLLLASGCGQQGAARETGLDSSQQRPTIRIAYPGISATIWPFMYGKEKGIFEQEGLDVEMNRIRGVPQIIATLLSGDIDIAWVGFDGMASAVSQGATDLRYIGEFLTEFPLYLVVAPHINSFDDLRGEPVATAGPGSITETLFLEGLRRGGLTDPRKDTDFMNMSGPDTRLTQLINGTFVGVALNAPWAQQAEARGFRILQYQGDFLLPWGGEGPITTTRAISSKRQALQGLMNGLGRSIRELKENRGEAIKVATVYMKLEPALAEKVYDVMMPVFKFDGEFGLEGIQRTFDSKSDPGQKIEASQFLDESFL